MEAFIVAVEMYLCTLQQNLDIFSNSRRMKITENQRDCQKKAQALQRQRMMIGGEKES